VKNKTIFYILLLRETCIFLDHRCRYLARRPKNACHETDCDWSDAAADPAFGIERRRAPFWLRFSFFFLAGAIYAANEILVWVHHIFGSPNLPTAFSAVERQAHEMPYGRAP
jgi:hypothetical protein